MTQSTTASKYKAKVKPFISAEQIAERLKGVVDELTLRLTGQDILAVTVMNGGMLFAADVLRQMPLPMQMSSIWATSYHGATTKSTGQVHLSGVAQAMQMAAGKHVLILDDILDTGYTLSEIQRAFHDAGAKAITTAVLLHKQRVQEVPIEADVVAFDIPDVFVVGYGLDYDGYYRHLPFVGELVQV